MSARLTRWATAALAVACMAPLAHAQSSSNYPDRTIRIMVGYAPGGGIDTMARILAESLSKEVGQSVIVENRAGAAGMLAADAVAKAAPDGYTLLMGDTSLLIAPHIQQKAVMQPLKELKPVAGVFESQLLVVANNNFPASNPKELIDLIKANPDKFSYATSGIGSIHHMGFEMLKERAGLSILHVPYRGAAQLIPDIVSNQVPLGVVSYAAGRELAQGGKLKAVALLTAPREGRASMAAPVADVIPGFSVGPQQILFAPLATPDAIVQRIAQAVEKVLATPEVKEAAARNGVLPAYVPPAQLAKDLAAESEQWARLVESRGIRIEQ